MEDQNIISYRQALQALWDLDTAMPNEDSPDMGEWMRQFNLQSGAVARTRHQLGSNIATEVYNQARQEWEARQS